VKGAIRLSLALAMRGSPQGAVDASKLFGSGYWLVTVQAHTQSAPQPGFDLVPNSSSGKASQLLLVKIPGSTP
jgi:hypothetical protein